MTSDEGEEAYSPSDTRSFTPPPPSGISKFAQPILEKVSNITIPPNLQEILANVKRQESSKVDPYLPSKPSATFLTTVNSSVYQNSEKYSSPSPSKISVSGSSSKSSSEKSPFDVINHRESVSKEKEKEREKESKSTLSSLSDLDLIRKAEEELAAVAAASAASAATSDSCGSDSNSQSSLPTTTSSLPTIMGGSSPTVMPVSTASISNLIPDTSSPPPPLPSSLPPPPPTLPLPVPLPVPHPLSISPRDGNSYKSPFSEPFKRNIAPEQPKPPGLEDEDFPPFPSTPPNVDNTGSKSMGSRSKFVPKSGIVMSVKRKLSDEASSPSSSSPTKSSRVKSRWGQGPSESGD